MLRKMTIATVIMSSLSACASVTQAVNAYGSAALTGARATNDTLIEANKAALCAIPLSALVRHAELIPAVKSLCLAPNDTATADVLDALPHGGK